MAEPTVELDARTSGSATYSVAIIDGGSVQSGTLRWASTESSTANVVIPESGNKWAEWLIWDSTADSTLISSTQQPSGTPVTATFKLSTSDTATFDTSPRITVYDSASHTEAEEVCVGTTAHTSPLIKGRINSASTAPAQYWGETDDPTLHAKESAGGVTPVGNNGLCGTTNYLDTNTTDLYNNPRYFWLAFSVPYDATTGVDAIDCVLTIEYTYT